MFFKEFTHHEMNRGRGMDRMCSFLTGLRCLEMALISIFLRYPNYVSVSNFVNPCSILICIMLRKENIHLCIVPFKLLNSDLAPHSK